MITITEKLNQIDKQCFKRGLAIRDLRSLYESADLNAQDKAELKKLLNGTDDPDVVQAFLMTKEQEKENPKNEGLDSSYESDYLADEDVVHCDECGKKMKLNPKSGNYYCPDCEGYLYESNDYISENFYYEHDGKIYEAFYMDDIDNPVGTYDIMESCNGECKKAFCVDGNCTENDVIDKIKGSKKKVKESYWNPTKWASYFWDMENKYVDMDAWNSANQTERDAMVLPAIKAFVEKYGEELDKLDEWDEFLEDLTDNNFHTEVKLFANELKNRQTNESLNEKLSNLRVVQLNLDLADCDGCEQKIGEVLQRLGLGNIVGMSNEHGWSAEEYKDYLNDEQMSRVQHVSNYSIDIAVDKEATLPKDSEIQDAMVDNGIECVGCQWGDDSWDADKYGLEESVWDTTDKEKEQYRKNPAPFADDMDKMRDYFDISKDEFLSSYSYLTEEEYDATTQYLLDNFKSMREAQKFYYDLFRHYSRSLPDAEWYEGLDK